MKIRFSNILNIVLLLSVIILLLEKNIQSIFQKESTADTINSQTIYEEVIYLSCEGQGSIRIDSSPTENEGDEELTFLDDMDPRTYILKKNKDGGVLGMGLSLMPYVDTNEYYLVSETDDTERTDGINVSSHIQITLYKISLEIRETSDTWLNDKMTYASYWNGVCKIVEPKI